MKQPKRKYATKSLVDGYKCGKQYAGMTLVAVPKQHARAGLRVECGNEYMLLPATPPVLSLQFNHKYGNGVYMLKYYEWKPAPIPTQCMFNFANS